jgi:hypothetical protein
MKGSRSTPAGKTADRRRSRYSIAATAALATVTLVSAPAPSLADEGGVSFWIPGFFGSLAVAPLQPGLMVSETFYHTSVSAGADIATAREITIGRFNPTLNLNLSGTVHANADLSLGSALYTLGTPVLGGQATIGVLGVLGHVTTDITATVSGTLGPIPFMRSDVISDAVTGPGDLLPIATLRWNHGVHNFMVYATGDLPVA